MKVAILGSSSSGNSTFISVNDKKILIDVGFSMKKLNEKLSQINENLENIGYIFITHEHSDHIKSLGSILRKYDISVYIHRNSFESIKDKIGKYDLKKINLLDDREIFLDDLLIKNFDLTHDASHCLGYSFEINEKKFTYITDTGYVSKTMKLNCLNSDILAIESNYDLDMLMNGSYPWDIKNRIKSKFGHLSNRDTLNLIKSIYEDNSCKLKKVFLMHLSEENNLEALALHNIKSNFLDIDVEVSGEEVTSVFEL